MIGGNYNNEPFRYGASYSSNAALTANVAVVVVTPASNVAGVIVHSAFANHIKASAPDVQMLAKTSAPASLTDGAPLLQVQRTGSTADAFISGVLPRSVFVPPGYGLYFISGGTETVGYRGALYTIL